jgi:hypothetical protein
MRRTRIEPGQRVDVRLTPQERYVILERTLVDDEMAACLRAATRRGSRLVVRLTLDDVDDLAGHLAAEANHCSEPRGRRVLDAVYDRLANIEDTFTDAEAPAETVVHDAKPFTAKQGQYLAYIYYYTKIHRRMAAVWSVGAMNLDPVLQRPPGNGRHLAGLSGRSHRRDLPGVGRCTAAALNQEHCGTVFTFWASPY